MTGKSELWTPHGHNMFEVSSMIQKAIRRGLITDACYSANEMASRYRPYLWKRLFTTSSEDCFDMLTVKLLELKKKDTEEPDNLKYLSEAVCYLVTARKNRDADYFACNLLNSRDKKPLASIEPSLTEAASNEYPTKNGHSMFDCSAALVSAINKGDYEGTGYSGNELYVRYREFFWRTLLQISKNLPKSVDDEVRALKEVDDAQQKSTSPTPIYAAKACVVLIKTIKYGVEIFKVHDYKVVKLDQFSGRMMAIPYYVYDCHTVQGRMRGKTKRDFVVEEQSNLSPLQKGDFDNASWERFFWLEEHGFYDADNLTPRPDKNRMKELNKGTVQLSLF